MYAHVSLLKHIILYWNYERLYATHQGSGFVDMADLYYMFVLDCEFILFTCSWPASNLGLPLYHIPRPVCNVQTCMKNKQDRHTHRTWYIRTNQCQPKKIPNILILTLESVYIETVLNKSIYVHWFQLKCRTFWKINKIRKNSHRCM